MKVPYRKDAGSYHLLKYCTLDLHCHEDQNSLKIKQAGFSKDHSQKCFKVCLWNMGIQHHDWSSNTQALSGKCIFKPLRKRFIKWWPEFPEMKSGADIYSALRRKRNKKEKRKGQKKVTSEMYWLLLET